MSVAPPHINFLGRNTVVGSMTKNPLINALAALLYISAVASFMFFGVEKVDAVPGLLVPIAMLSLFTLSAAVMGYIFLAQPLQMYIDGEKKGAVNLFVQTVACFAGLTILVLIALIAVPFGSHDASGGSLNS